MRHYLMAALFFLMLAVFLLVDFTVWVTGWVPTLSSLVADAGHAHPLTVIGGYILLCLALA